MRSFSLMALGLAALPTLSGCAKIESRDLIREGNALYSDSLYSQAIAKYDAAAKLESDVPELFWNRACAAEGLLLRLKDNDKKVKERKHYADMALRDFQAWYDLTKEKTPEDEKNFAEHRLAILSADARCDDLVAHWQGKLQKKPDDESLYSAVARTYDEVCDDKLKATQWYEKRTQDFPQSATAWYALGVRYFEPLFPEPGAPFPYNDALSAPERLQQAQKVIETLEKATKIKPNYRDPYVWRAMSYTQKSLAREFADNPSTPEEKLNAILAREDTMLAWKEQRQVCNIDKLPDCPLMASPAEILARPSAYHGEGKTVSLAGKVEAGSVKPVAGQDRSYEMLLAVKIEDSAQPVKRKKRRRKKARKPKSRLAKVKVLLTLVPPQKDENGQPIDDSEEIKARFEELNKGSKSSFDGVIAKDGSTLTVIEKPAMGCCPMAPISADDVASDQAMRKKLENQIARGGKAKRSKRRR